MADWESKPQGPSLNQTREIGYVVIKTTITKFITTEF